MTCPAKRRETVEQVQETLDLSERRVCRAMEQPRSTQRYEPLVADDEEQLTRDIVRLSATVIKVHKTPV